jgi:OOP family OmpA-OmpF porin
MISKSERKYINMSFMESGLKKATLLFLGIISGCQLFAQTTIVSAYRTWSVGVNGGISTPFTFLGNNKRQDFTSPNMELGYGAYIKKQISYSIGLQADFLFGKLQADQPQPNSTGSMPFSQFDTKLNWSASLSGNFILAHINGQHQKGLMQPYFTLGGGILSYTPALNLQNRTISNLKTQNDFFIPLGVGLKFDLAPGINLDFGYQVNFVNSDNVDGYIYGSTNDKFSYTHIGLEFALGTRSKPQMATHSMIASMQAEYMAREQKLKKSLQLQQTELDTDKLRNDKLRNDLDATNAVLTKLTIDSDGDGVPDVYDKCPNTPADTKVDGYGCPLPSNKQEVKVYITEQDRKIVNAAVKNLDFYFGTSTIREYSFPSLNKVAQLLINKNLNLKIEAYADNTGNADDNLRLSKERAEAVKSYLVGKGVDAMRIEALGYGEGPIATDKATAGRQLNRGIEFTLFSAITNK